MLEFRINPTVKITLTNHLATIESQMLRFDINCESRQIYDFIKGLISSPYRCSMESVEADATLKALVAFFRNRNIIRDCDSVIANVDPLIEWMSPPDIGITPLSIHFLDSDDQLLNHIRALIAALGVKIVTYDEADVIIYARSIDDVHDRMRVNHDIVASKKIGIFCYLNGVNITIGPVVRPHVTGCYYCYIARKYGELTGVSFGRSPSSENRIARHPEASLVAIATSTALVAAQLLQIIYSQWDNCLFDRIIHINLLSLQIETHDFLRSPSCTECGQGARYRTTVWPQGRA